MLLFYMWPVFYTTNTSRLKSREWKINDYDELLIVNIKFARIYSLLMDTRSDCVKAKLIYMVIEEASTFKFYETLVYRKG
jgi:hypothetical protein